MNATVPYTRAYEDCPACKGTGLTLNPSTGEPDFCRECHGECVVRARDEKGRFVGNIKALVQP